jgi:hypothetical protein
MLHRRLCDEGGTVTNTNAVVNAKAAMNTNDTDTTTQTDTQERSPEGHALALLRALADEDGQSLPRLAKRLGLAASELQRLRTALGEDPRFDGLGLIETRTDLRDRECLWLSARGRRFLCDAGLVAGSERYSGECDICEHGAGHGGLADADSDVQRHG